MERITVVVTGPTKSGKTRLIDAFIQAATELGLNVDFVETRTLKSGRPDTDWPPRYARSREDIP